MLSCVLSGIKKGFCGSERKGTKVSTGVDAVDLRDQHNNATRVCYQTWGAKEEFQSGTLGGTITRQPFWFKFGKTCVIEVKEQIEIAKELIGDIVLGVGKEDPEILPIYVKRQRHNYYPKFF